MVHTDKYWKLIHRPQLKQYYSGNEEKPVHLAVRSTRSALNLLRDSKVMVREARERKANWNELFL